MRKLFLFFILICFNGISVCQAEENKPRQLSLQESILLAVRKNPNVQITQLNHVLQKFAVEVQEWEFSPHYAFEAKHTTSRTYSVTTDGQVTSNVSGIQPSASLLTPIGTKITAASVNNVTDHYNPGLSLQVIQPLMKGFGRPIVEAELYNALDSEKISRLNLQGELRNTVTAVINAYLDVISAKNNLEVDQDALSRAELSLQQTKKFIKAGHKAGVELVTVKAGIANMRTRIESDKNTLEQSRYALLTSIGLDPDTKVDFSNIDINELINKYHLPTLNESKNRILENDIQYQVAQIILQGANKRAVLIAKDNVRWQLDLTLDASSGNSSGGGRNAGINSLVNGINRANSATLDLIIPIDDRASKNQLASTIIALRQSEIALRQEKWAIQTNVINGWKNIFSAERVLRYAEDAKQLQRQSYQISAKKYSFGFIDSLELQTAQTDLVSAERDLVDNRINYLKALVTLDSLTGMTLKTWDVIVNYG